VLLKKAKCTPPGHRARGKTNSSRYQGPRRVKKRQFVSCGSHVCHVTSLKEWKKGNGKRKGSALFRGHLWGRRAKDKKEQSVYSSQRDRLGNSWKGKSKVGMTQRNVVGKGRSEPGPKGGISKKTMGIELSEITVERKQQKLSLGA